MKILDRYRKKSGRQGFVMLEVLAAAAVIGFLSASIAASAAAIHQRTLRRVEEKEAYDAAVTTVRMMALEIMENDNEPGTISEKLLCEPGLALADTVLAVETDTGESRKDVPVKIASKAQEERVRVILYAEASVGGVSRAVTLTMEKEEGGWELEEYGLSETWQDK